jgi:hypothetical protein
MRTPSWHCPDIVWEAKESDTSDAVGSHRPFSASRCGADISDLFGKRRFAEKLPAPSHQFRADLQL